MAVLTHMLSGQPACLPFIIIHTMREVSIHTHMSLPYGMVLTKIFRACGVDLATETEVETLHSGAQKFNSTTLLRMKYILVNNVYQRAEMAPAREARPAQEEEEEDEPDLPAQEGSPAEAPESTHMDIPTDPSPPQRTIEDLYLLMSSGFDQIQSTLTTVVARIDNLDARLQKFEPYLPPSSPHES